MQVSHKGKEKVDPAPIFDVSCGQSHVDGESNGSEMSLDEELGIPLVVTLGVRRMLVRLLEVMQLYINQHM